MPGNRSFGSSEASLFSYVTPTKVTIPGYLYQTVGANSLLKFVTNTVENYCTMYLFNEITANLFKQEMIPRYSGRRCDPRSSLHHAGVDNSATSQVKIHF